VAQLSDGLVTLPADARTLEQLEWVAEQVREAEGTAAVWLARPTSRRFERELAGQLAAARAAEYQQVLLQVASAELLPLAQRRRLVRSLRSQLRRLHRRDFFPPPERDAAVAAVEGLAAEVTEPAPGSGRHSAPATGPLRSSRGAG
jgi:hypothetical protein